MTELNKYEQYAERIRIFNGLTPEEVEYILKQGQVLQFYEGQTIFHEGQLGTNLFIVLSGKVALYSKNKIIVTLHLGDAFGEMAVLNRKPRTATAAAVSPVKVFTLNERQLNDILEKHIAVRLLLNIIHMLSERLENANTLISEYRRRGS